MSDDLVGELRELAHGVPGDACYEAIVALGEHIDPILDAELVDYVAAVLQRWPTTLERHVPQRWVDDLLSGFARPALCWCSALRCHGQRLGHQAIARLRDCALLEHVVALRLSHNQLEPVALGALQNCALTRGLRTLSIAHNALGDRGARVLSRLPWLEAIEVLTLSSAAIGESGLTALLRKAPLGQLRALTLQRDVVAPQWFKALSGLSSLRALTLSDVELREPQVVALAHALGRRPLTTLELHRCALGPQGARLLADCPHLDALTALDLSHNALGGEGLRALAASQALCNLRALRVVDYALDVATFVAIVSPSSPWMRRLEHLDLRGLRLDDEGAASLASAEALAGLTTLKIDTYRCALSALRTLLASPYFAETVKAPWRAALAVRGA